MRSASLLEINKFGGGRYGCDELKRAKNGFGSQWLTDWQEIGGE